MKYAWWLVLLIISSFGGVCAQGEDESSSGQDSGNETTHALIPPAELGTTREYQAEDVAVVTFDKEKWKEIVGRETFEETPRKRFAPNFSVPWAGPLLRIITYTVIVGLIVFVIYVVIRNATFETKIRKEKLAAADGDAPVEDIGEIDIQALLEQAKREGNFKAAIRLYYLGLLKKLHEMGKIVWKKDKTNRDYLSELFSRNFYFQEIRGLTTSYEAVWYGDHDLNSDSFHRLSARFEDVLHQLNTGAS